MMNNSGPRYKRSQLERHLNTVVLWCVLLLFIMCLTAAIGHGLWLKNLKDPVFKVDTETSPALAGFYVFWTMIIVLQVHTLPFHQKQLHFKNLIKDSC
ncbi:probable phospholipid-transporting ATPase VD [Notothenia coriiceps]|uniref:Probable phospholipid-transporting ATPase VD n=1 Tax=Notothenia coriiceps TaxID=8208 RepID=A0A6I9NAP0_9TELE|nr:PREDICTED: probable phospholipid-transporting ATPase VD [Notothenia coriiceps]